MLMRPGTLLAAKNIRVISFVPPSQVAKAGRDGARSGRGFGCCAVISRLRQMEFRKPPSTAIAWPVI